MTNNIRTPRDQELFNQGAILSYKNVVPGVTDQDNLFRASNISRSNSTRANAVNVDDHSQGYHRPISFAAYLSYLLQMESDNSEMTAYKSFLLKEELDEISKETLHNYVAIAKHKAGKLVAAKSDIAGEVADYDRFKRINPDHKSTANDEKWKNSSLNKIKNLNRKIKNRATGIGRATIKSMDESVNEETQLDEISKEKLGNYIHKAAHDLDVTSHKTGYDNANRSSPTISSWEFNKLTKRIDKNTRKTENRVKYIRKAAKKLSEGSNYWADLAKRLSKDADKPKPYKHVLSMSHPENGKTAKIYHDRDFVEYKVKHYHQGKHLPKADYHTDDFDDAVGTAKHWIK